MNEGLYEIIVDRLDADRVQPEIEALILAACEGEEALSVLFDKAESVAEGRRDGASSAALPGIFLKGIAVEGFRGIGPSTALETSQGPGLTLVVGRNGSGKSSFAEALEILLTGSNKRWEARSAVWKEGWKNLHHEAPTRITASFLVEGHEEPLTVTRAWTSGRGLEESESWLELPTGECHPYRDPGWERALADFRPFLSYNELGGMLTGRPVDLYHALSAGLGLEEVEAARERLRRRRLDEQNTVKQADQRLQLIVSRLLESDDERARACLDAISHRSWDLDTVSNVVLGERLEAGNRIEQLRHLAALDVPSKVAVHDVVSELRSASASLEPLAGTAAAKDAALADLLEDALQFHAVHGDQDCPVCRQGVLDEPWRRRALQERNSLRRQAAELEAARRKVAEAVNRAHSLPSAFSALDQSEDVGISISEVCEAVEEWARKDEISEPRELADYLDGAFPRLTSAAEACRNEARRELDRRQAEWIPLAQELVSWLELGRAAEAADERSRRLKEAEDWIKKTSIEIQQDRFRPIAERAEEIWKMLRQQSSVELEEIGLKGSGSHGSVALDVSVDGRPGVALGVMSQGELHALALSLFFPRAMRPESPFRFLVIDDPVQSMDPARVDGLARVLEDCARARQVIVFTHDSRLAESVHRLQINATVLLVTRSRDSRIGLEIASDPVTRYLEDAVALMHTDDLTLKVRRRAVPGLCRHALEAACDEAIRRRRLGRGEGYREVEKLLVSCHRLSERLALTFCDDPGKSSEVHGRLRNIGPWAVDAFQACNRGTHQLTDLDLERLVRDSRKLAEKIRTAL